MVDNVYLVSRDGYIQDVVQTRPGDPHDITALIGTHLAETIHDPYVTNHLMTQIHHTLFTSWPGETLIPVRITDALLYRIVTIEKTDGDHVTLFIRPADE